MRAASGGISDSRLFISLYLGCCTLVSVPSGIPVRQRAIQRKGEAVFLLISESDKSVGGITRRSMLLTATKRFTLFVADADIAGIAG